MIAAACPLVMQPLSARCLRTLLRFMGMGSHLIAIFTSSTRPYCRGLNIHERRPRCKHSQAQLGHQTRSVMIMLTTQATELTCRCLQTHAYVHWVSPYRIV